jgi:hypothetical protein
MSDHRNSHSQFRYADGILLSHLKKELLAQPKALSEAERSSLVKRSKSRTSAKPVVRERDLSIYEPIKEIDHLRPVFEVNSIGAGMFTVIQYREWSDEYRIRTRVETSLLSPPLSEGARYSDMLSSRGARKITESCYYMANKQDGYKTFVTGTFEQKIRQEIQNGQTTIQREVSRTMNSMQKMFQRGWTDSAGNRICGHDEPLAYCWVVEIPKNDKGEENPHVHMMLNWRVDRQIFDDWSSHIESLWGNGFFHLEKIKDPLCAGSYMAKAAGYITKGSKQNNQGLVKGNRYGISKTARAPGWHIVTESELGVMGKLISEINEMCQSKYGDLYNARNQLKKSLDRCPKNNGNTRRSIGKKLQAIREKISDIPLVSSKYQLIIKGSKVFNWFLGWAIGAGWSPNKRPSSRWLEMFNISLRHRKNRRTLNRLKWVDHEWSQAVNDYSNYEQFEEEENLMYEWFNYSSEYCQ